MQERKAYYARQAEAANHVDVASIIVDGMQQTTTAAPRNPRGLKNSTGVQMPLHIMGAISHGNPHRAYMIAVPRIFLRGGSNLTFQVVSEVLHDVLEYRANKQLVHCVCST